MADPTPMSRKDLEELIRSVLTDPDVLDLISVSSSAKPTSASQQSDPVMLVVVPRVSISPPGGTFLKKN
jgi:hypothetical protein